jgi:hypothetical protein
MKKSLGLAMALPFPAQALICMVFTGLLFGSPARAAGLSMEEIQRKFEAMEKRIQVLERSLKDKDKQIEELKKQRQEQEKKIEAIKKETSHIKGHPRPTPADKVSRPEKEKKEEGLLEKWYQKIELSGAIELEYGNERHKQRDPAEDFKKTKTYDDDIIAATVELGVDAQINKYVRGHILFLWEEDEENEHVVVDEATILIGGIDETYGLYFLGGRYYPHFGELNSSLISDPLTLEIFEIRETAAQVGYDGEWFSVGAGVFHGDVQQDEKYESRIQGYFADANFHNPEGTLGGVCILAGLSYLSNVADSDTLQDQVVDRNGDGDPNDLDNLVDGLALYLVAQYWKFTLGAEYITALDYFRPGEMVYAIDRYGMPRRSRPSAWNLELAFQPIDPLTLAIRYEGSDDLFGLFPKYRYGGSVSYEVFKYTTLSVEYLHGVYDSNNRNEDGMVENKVDTLTFQLAIEFP